MSNDNKPKQNKKTSIYFIIAGIILIIAIVAGIFWMNSKKDKEEKTISYTDLIKQIDDGVIEKVEMTVGSTTIKVKIKDVEEEKEAIVPNTQAFIELIQDQKLKGNEIELIQKQQNMFYTTFQYLFSLLPTILLIILFVAVFKMQGLGDKGKIYDAETTKSKIKFNDVAGLDEEKNEMIEIVDFLKEPKKFYEMGAKIPRGVLLCGQPGTGKTLIAKTLLGFYNYTGNIYIGNTNIKEVNQKSIRKYVGIVLQDTYIFNDSIKNNINVTNKNLTDDDITRLCKISCLEKDIEEFDDKYNHILENNGSNISGGQKQRIAIARTLAMNTEYIIFDDSLSKLDNATKLEILNNLIEMNKGTIIISHDRNVVEKCSHVLFIDNNNVIYDTHSNLLNNPNYSKLIDVDDNVILEED